MKPVNLIAHLLRIAILGVVLGAVAATFAAAFVEAIKWLGAHLYTTAQSRDALDAQFKFSAWLFLLPALGGLAVGLLLKFAVDARAHGPADVIYAAQSDKLMPTRSGLVVALSAVIGAGGGASIGQYGPLVHLGGTVGSAIARIGKIEPALGIGCGVAAGIACAFGAPIAGIIFAHEVVLRHYSLRAFAPITVAAVTGFFVAEHVFHREPLFQVATAHAVYAHEFAAFVAIGALGALVSMLYMHAILFARRIAKLLPAPNWIKPALAGLAVGIGAQWVPEILGVGGETLRAAITPGAYGAAQLAVILAAKIIATGLCMGFGFAGGVFSPALLIGILFGAIVGHGAEALYGGLYSDLGFYAVCGMAAVTGPVIGAPLATILIVFELTHNYELTVAVMISVAFANLVACRLFGRSLFDRELATRGFDLSAGRDKLRLSQRNISAQLSDDFLRTTIGAPLTEIKRAMRRAECFEAHVVDQHGVYVGVLALPQLLNAEQAGQQHLDRAQIDTDALRFVDSMSVWAAMEAMKQFVGMSIAVVDARGQLRGVVHESSLVAAYLKITQQSRAEEHAH